MAKTSSMPSSASAAKSADLVAKVPGRVETPGTRNRRFDAPSNRYDTQLMPASRATPLRMMGVLKARLAR